MQHYAAHLQSLWLRVAWLLDVPHSHRGHSILSQLATERVFFFSFTTRGLSLHFLPGTVYDLVYVPSFHLSEQCLVLQCQSSQNLNVWWQWDLPALPRPAPSFTWVALQRLLSHFSLCPCFCILNSEAPALVCTKHHLNGTFNWVWTYLS